MQEVYRIYVTDAYYPQDGVNTYEIVDEDAFNLFVTDRLEDVKPPEDFEDVSDWLRSLDVDDINFPFIIKGEAWLWGNC